jgi:hypothetical protein
MFITPMPKAPTLPVSGPPTVDRDHAAAIEPDAPAVEQVRRVAPAAGLPAAAGPAAAEVEDAAALEEEVALLREEQAEARQVDLLLVDLDLREVGVDGEVGRQVGGDAVLEVAAERRSRTRWDHRRDAARSVLSREHVGLELHVRLPAAGRAPPACPPTTRG